MQVHADMVTQLMRNHILTYCHSVPSVLYQLVLKKDHALKVIVVRRILYNM